MELEALARRIWSATNNDVIQPVVRLCLEYWKQDDKSALYIVMAAIVGFAIGRYRRARSAWFQNPGEKMVSESIASRFGAPNYHLMNHLTLRFKGSTTQIDHVLVSRFGVFVIETKDYSGWIFGSAGQAFWTKVHFSDKFRFQNPLHQNMAHVQAVRECLDFLPQEIIKPIVVFVGTAEFKTAVPEGVFDIAGLLGYIQSHTTEVISANRMQFCVGRLETERLAISDETDVRHIENLNKRYGNFL